MNLEDFMQYAFQEDIGEGDHTSLACIPNNARGRAHLLVKEEGVLAGLEIAEKIFRYTEEDIKLKIFLKDSDHVKRGDIAFEVQGTAQAILKAERLVLNCMQRMSGIATLTNKFVQEVKGLNTKILDTRKTTPGLRFFEKWAVRLGGGHNHRMGLFDMIMIKDNHISFSGGIRPAIEKANKYLKRKKLDLQIEIEVRNFKELEEVLSIGGIHRIMLDNFLLSDLRPAVKMINGKYETEISGNVNLSNVRQYALCGVDYISVGALTHSAKSLDLSLKAF